MVKLKSLTIKQLLVANVHLGHKVSRWNAKTRFYLYGIRYQSHTFDLEKTINALRQAMIVLELIIFNKGKILCVGSHNQTFNKELRKLSFSNSQYFIGKRWLNGLLSNWKNLYNKIQKLNKKEILKINTIPDLIFLFYYNKTIINEANRLDIPVITILDSNINPSKITYSIPGNNDSEQSLNLYCNLINYFIKKSFIKEKLSIIKK
jgi:small subunit ribosomal protein S2